VLLYYFCCMKTSQPGMSASSLVQRDQQFIWHPYTQMQTAPAPVAIVKGKGTLLFDENDHAYIDAISSWWVNILGHGHPLIAEKIAEQAVTLEHCIFAGFTHPPAVNLAERLLQILPQNQAKVFYSDNGSTAVEVALKMAIQFWHNQGIKRNRILALQHAYHGDTFGAMSVSGRSIFTRAFDEYLFEVDFIDLPDNEKEFPLSEKELSQYAAFIFEPLVLGSGGMLMYEPAALDKWVKICRQHNVLIIADEVMTGFGRTGKKFAVNYISEQPDIICLSKGITGGTMAMGVTTCTQPVYDAFLSDDKLKTLFHGHSYTANPITCTAALASMDLFLSAEYQGNIGRIVKRHAAFAKQLGNYSCIKNIRQTGTIIAFDIVTGEADSYTHSLRDFLYHFFLQRFILLRPLGNTLYMMPPYCITDEELQKVYQAIIELADVIMGNKIV
jgi:adenosylmethionine---8-amino-7-oxononanoate aminotransferase